MQEYELNKAVIISPLIDGDSAEETISGALYSIKGIALPTDDGLMATGKLKDLISYMWNPAK